MIQLHTDYLVFETTNGCIPCSAEQVVIELVGESVAQLDPEIVRNAAAGVLHYFKVELGREQVTVAEFSVALVRVLRGLGLAVIGPDSALEVPPVAQADLRELACASGKGFELAFFNRLRTEMQGQLRRGPRVLRFVGLRPCVKQLAGARRWSGRCQALNDQIVEYLRCCLCEVKEAEGCSLVVE